MATIPILSLFPPDLIAILYVSHILLTNTNKMNFSPNTNLYYMPIPTQYIVIKQYSESYWC